MTQSRRITWVAIVVGLMVCVSLPRKAHPQVSPTPIGSRVRISLVPDRRFPLGFDRPMPIVGNVLDWRADTLVISIESLGAIAGFPPASIERLDVSRGSGSRLGGMLRTGWRGLLTGLITVGPPASFAVHRHGSDAVRDAILLSGGIGALAGLTVGAIVSHDRWERVRE